MRRFAVFVSLSFALLAGRAQAQQQQPARRMSLDECIAEAMARSPDVRISEADLHSAEGARGAARGEMGPKLHAEGNALRWNGAFELPFAIPGSPGPTPVLTVRDPFTWSATVSLIQPLTSLFGIYERYHARDLGVDVAALQRDASRRDVAFRVAESYLTVLESARLLDIAQVSVKQLEAQQQEAQSLFQNGVIGKNDFLRAGLALASARERVIQTGGRMTMARARLASAMGLSADAAVEPAPLAADLPPIEDATASTAESRALARRLELQIVGVRVEAADATVSMQRGRLLPQSSVVGSYIHSEGSAFQEKNSAYVGVNASWDVWDWGATYGAIREAKGARERALAMRAKLEDEIRLEARQAFVDMTSAREALSVSQTAVEQAEENFRIVSRRFGANSATSFDVVDAEALLTQARARVESARTAYLAARFALQRATGESVPRLR